MGGGVEVESNVGGINRRKASVVRHQAKPVVDSNLPQEIFEGASELVDVVLQPG